MQAQHPRQVLWRLDCSVLSLSLGHMSDYAFFFKRLSFFVFLTPISRQAHVPLIARRRYATVA